MFPENSVLRLRECLVPFVVAALGGGTWLVQGVADSVALNEGPCMTLEARPTNISMREVLETGESGANLLVPLNTRGCQGFQ